MYNRTRCGYLLRQVLFWYGTEAPVDQQLRDITCKRCLYRSSTRQERAIFQADRRKRIMDEEEFLDEEQKTQWCAGMTLKGKPCSHLAIQDEKYCFTHLNGLGQYYTSVEGPT